MDEILTLEQIYQKYPLEWVLIDDPDVDEQFEVRRGRVACHHSSRDEFYRQALAIKPAKSAVLFTGPVVPPGAALAL